jgi:hypothetical protein
MHPKDADYLKLCIHSKFNESWTQDAEVKKSLLVEQVSGKICLKTTMITKEFLLDNS